MTRVTVKAVWSTAINYWLDRGLLKTNQATKIKPTKAQQRHAVKNKKYGLELNEYANILKYMEAAGTDLRTRVLIELMFQTGMRISDATKFCQSELVRNQRNTGWNADFRAQKNGKDCSVPLTDDLVGMLKSLPFLHDRFWFHTRDTTLRYRAQHLGGEIAKIFKAVQKEFGAFAHHASAHTMRHTFAVQNLNNGADPKMVADWMGDDLATILKHYSHEIKSSIELKEDKGREARDAMQEKIRAMGTENKVVEFTRKRA
jgi:site-specific recombinase XerD